MSAARGFLAEYASSVCAMYQPCCESENLGFDQAGCTDWFQRVTGAYWNGDYRAAQGEACLDAVRDAHAADAGRCSSVPLFDEATFRAKCAESFGPSVREGKPLGGQCLSSTECAGSPDGDVICYGGACLLQTRGQVGDGPCNLAGGAIQGLPKQAFTCDASNGLYCHRANNVCAPRVGDGEPCPYTTACFDTALCSGGICQRLPEPGERCLNAIPGAGGYCRAGSVCDVPTLTCASGLTTGQTCRDSKHCTSGACIDGNCVASDFKKSLNCVGANP